MTIAARLDEAVKAVCPIFGVSIGLPGDKTTWRISFKDEATAEQRAAAQAVVDAFDLQVEAAMAQRVATDEQERASCKLDATIMGLVDQTRAQWRTWAGANFPTLTNAEKTRLGDLFWVVSIGVRQRVRNGG